MYPNVKVATEPAIPPITAGDPDAPPALDDDEVDWKREFCVRMRAVAGLRGMGRLEERAMLPALDAIRFESGMNGKQSS